MINAIGIYIGTDLTDEGISPVPALAILWDDSDLLLWDDSDDLEWDG